MVIYKATNKINGRCYIGQTIKPLYNRKLKHETTNNKNTYFTNAIKKYGKENFEWEVIEECNSKEELDEMEFHYIKQYNSIKPYGYNLTCGGEGTWGYRHTENSKNKMKGERPNIKGKNNPNYGKEGVWKNKKFSDAHRNKISNSLKGRSYSESTIKKMSDAKKGDKAPNWGKKFSDAHKKKLSLATKGRKRNNLQKCPFCGRMIDKQNYARWHGNNCKYKNEARVNV